MQTRTKVLLAVGLMGLATMGYAALAEAGKGLGDAGGRGRSAGRLRLGERLGLTEEQRGKIKSVWESRKDEFRPLAEKMAAERKAMRELVQAEAVDEAAIRAQAAKVASVAADLAVARARIAHEIRPLLSAEQKQRLQELKAGVEKRRAEWQQRIASRESQG